MHLCISASALVRRLPVREHAWTGLLESERTQRTQSAGVPSQPRLSGGDQPTAQMSTESKELLG